MKMKNSINSFKQRISYIFEQTKEQLKPNIFRGSSRSVSSDVEDNVALLISEMLPKNYKFFLSPSIRVNRKNNKPDLLIVDDEHNVLLMVEMKTNMGYCRDAEEVLNKQHNLHETFCAEKKLICKFSDGNEFQVAYTKNVKLFLISMSSRNCSPERHKANKSYAQKIGIEHYILFDGEYNSLENYADFPLRMWGTYEMNSGLRKMYRYQSRVYYHEKKGWNLHRRWLFCLLPSTLTNLFYKGLKLISTYQDTRFRKTLKESLEVLKNGENIVIFPEISDEGYLDEMKGFYAGFVILAERCYKNEIDVSIYPSYFKIKEKVYLFDKPILYSELKKIAPTRKDMTKYLTEKCNALNNIEL